MRILGSGTDSVSSQDPAWHLAKQDGHRLVDSVVLKPQRCFKRGVASQRGSVSRPRRQILQKKVSRRPEVILARVEKMDVIGNPSNLWRCGQSGVSHAAGLDFRQW